MPQDAICALYEATSGEAYVTSDVGQHQMFAAQYYKFDYPRRWINSGGLGTMGFGLPAAMGIKIALPDADVACVTGEGSIQMNIQELSTCSQYGCPVKIINLRNDYLGMVKQWQDMQYEGRYSESHYAASLPDFVKLAEAYGHVGMEVKSQSDLLPAMKESFSLKDRLVFMDILIDPDEHVYPMMVAPNGAMKDMWLNKTERTDMRRILQFASSESGALSRGGLVLQRGYNIETLNVAPTEDHSLSRLTVTTSGDDSIEQVTKHLNKIIDVVKVVDLTEGAHVERDTLLVKVRAVDGQRDEVKRTTEIFPVRLLM